MRAASSLLSPAMFLVHRVFVTSTAIAMSWHPRIVAFPWSLRLIYVKMPTIAASVESTHLVSTVLLRAGDGDDDSTIAYYAKVPRWIPELHLGPP